MLNTGRCETGTKINCSNGNYIFIFPESIISGLISVRDKFGNALWQKQDCTFEDIPFAIEVAKRGIQTGVFES